MKRFMALILSLLFVFSLCACTDSGTTPSGNTEPEAEEVISKELQGKWYGPNSDPVLNINPDGTGNAEYLGESFDATFTATEDVFTVSSTGYSISGNYTLEEDMLTVTITYGGSEYVLVFTRTPVELPEGSYVFSYEDTAYEIIPESGTITVCSFPPEENPPTIWVYFVSKTEKIYIPYPAPPENYGKGEAETQPEGDTPDIPLPEELDVSGEKPKVTVGGTDTEVYESSDDIVGTWSTDNVDTTISIFGATTTTTSSMVYTFNADGTGTVVAMGFITGSITYSCENGVLDLTVSMLGQTESGTGYVKRVGDTLFVVNTKGKTEVFGKIG